MNTQLNESISPVNSQVVSSCEAAIAQHKSVIERSLAKARVHVNNPDLRIKELCVSALALASAIEAMQQEITEDSNLDPIVDMCHKLNNKLQHIALLP